MVMEKERCFSYRVSLVMNIRCWQPVRAHRRNQKARAEKYEKSAERKRKEGKSRIVREVWKDDFSVEKALESDSRSFNTGEPKCAS